MFSLVCLFVCLLAGFRKKKQLSRLRGRLWILATWLSWLPLEVKISGAGLA